MKIVITVLIIILIGLQVRLWTGSGSFSEIDRLNSRVEVQAIENNELEERNNDLYKEVDELQTGLDAIEERARNDLGLIKEGETFYLIVEDE